MLDRVKGLAESAGLPVFLVQGDSDQVPPELGQWPASSFKLVAAKPARLGIYNVPTVVRVDAGGVVRAEWVGSPDPRMYEAVAKMLMAGSPEVSTELHSLTRRELSRWREQVPDLQVVDVAEAQDLRAVSDLGHVLQMPGSEVAVRAKFELKPNVPVVVDCRPVGRRYCQAVMMEFRKLGFRSISGLNYSAQSGLWSYLVGSLR